MTVPEPAPRDPPRARQGDEPVRYRLRSEDRVEGTDTWEVQWQPVPPAEGPPVVRRLSRERFLALDATGLLDSSCAFTAHSLASFLSESMPLHDGRIRAATITSNRYQPSLRVVPSTLSRLPAARAHESKREEAMVRCPVCKSVQVGFLVSPRRTSCYYCGATWLQDGSDQEAVRATQPRDGEFAHPSRPDASSSPARRWLGREPFDLLQ